MSDYREHIIVFSIVGTVVIFCIAGYLLKIDLGSNVTRYARPGTTVQREPNAHEFFYYTVGVDMDAPELCKKISPGAYTAAGANPKGYQISYLKSQCFKDIAINTRNPKLCDEVIPLSTLFVDGSKISKEQCLEEVKNSSGAGARVAGEGSAADLGRILGEMGYERQTIAADFSRQRWEMYWQHPTYKSYEQAIKDQYFLTRLNQLPDFGSEPTTAPPRRANRYEMFYQMVAVDLSKPPLCEKIAPMAYVVKEQYARGFQAFALRSRCLMTVAVNAEDTTLCDSVQALDASRVEKARFLDGHNISKIECVRQIEWNTKSKRGGLWGGGHSGPIPHDSPEELAAVLHEIGYDSAGNNPEDFSEIPNLAPLEYYGTFVYGKNRNRREEFLNKVRALPSFHE